MRYSFTKITPFDEETTLRHTFLSSDLQCLPPGDPRILCAKHRSPITGKSSILIHLHCEAFNRLQITRLQIDKNSKTWVQRGNLQSSSSTELDLLLPPIKRALLLLFGYHSLQEAVAR